MDIEHILKQMADKGQLVPVLTDKDIEAILKHAPEVKTNDDFKRRAIEAIRLAQKKA